jgi:3D (Asp-Asp-Asp) domain-containing protein
VTSAAVAAPSRSENLRYKKVLKMRATAYSAKEPGLNSTTASGMKAVKGVVAVDPKVIPLGTKVYVETSDGRFIYGNAVAADTGGAIKGSKIDLCMNTVAECNRFGVRDVNVYILE